MALRLYKFINQQYGLEALKNKRLKISRISELNDPFEFLGVNLGNAQNRWALGRLKDLISESRGIICMSHSWSNPLLWSHYADSHKGMCLGFDVPKIFFKPVEYRKERLSLPEMKFSSPGEHELELVERTIGIKFDHWQYEEEYRAFPSIKETDTETGHAFFEFSDHLILREIIIGANNELSRDYIEKRIHECGHSIAPLKARAAFTKFKVIEQKDKNIW